MKKIFLFLVIGFSLLLSSCKNADIEFPDYKYSTVYFAYQTPVRTITLGEDIVNTDLDNAHKCKIMATIGGVYSNKKDVIIDFVVDNSLCDGVKFKADNSNVVAMPSNYYTLASNKIVIPSGSIIGGVEVQLTDAFFADPLALTNHYVIPLVMTNVQNADSILSGKANTTNPNRVKTDNWDVVPKDYILYAIKYINPYDGYYLRRGKDVVTVDGATSTAVRHAQYVENDAVWRLNSLSLTSINFPLDLKNSQNTNLNMSMRLNFDNNDKCTVAPTTTAYQLNDTVRVYNITATGNGAFVKKGEKSSWGNKDRDGLYLNYELNYDVEINSAVSGIKIQTVKYNTVDTLVVRDRAVSMEIFEYVF